MCQKHSCVFFWGDAAVAKNTDKVVDNQSNLTNNQLNKKMTQKL